VKRYFSNALFFAVFAISAWVIEGRSQNEHLEIKIESVFTDLSITSCQEFLDQDDPNDTPYRKCPGVLGYTLVTRRVDSGRQSISVLTPAQEEFPLDYHEFVTRHMFHLDNKAEWRVIMTNGKKIPIALIVRVQAHEEMRQPERVTHSYLSVAKITPNEICVTDRILVDSLSPAEVRSTTDTAREKECLPAQPHLIVDKVIVR
jgi:hypothetical protein